MDLIVLAHRYPHPHDEIAGAFVKAQVDELAPSFDRVMVFASIPYIPLFIAKQMGPFREREALSNDYSYDNIEVVFIKKPFLPMGIGYHGRGKLCSRSIKKVLSKTDLRPKVVHAHLTWPQAEIATELGPMFDCPKVLTVHENHFWLKKETKDERITSVWSQMDSIISVSKRDTKILKRYNPNTVHIPNGYHPNVFHPRDKDRCRKQLKLDSKDKILVSIGRLETRKGYSVLIEALERLGRDDILTVLIGIGPLKSKLERQAKDANVRVMFPGAVESKDLADWVNAADLFILPSLSEGGPVVMYESQACGVPYIGSNVGGVKEFIDDPSLGTVVRAKDPKGLARAISKGLDRTWDHELIASHASSNTWSNISKRILALYDELS